MAYISEFQLPAGLFCLSPAVVLQAIGNTVKQLMTRLLESKTVKNLKQLFMKIEDRKRTKKAEAGRKGISLGDEVEQSISSFFQDHADAMCQQ